MPHGERHTVSAALHPSVRANIYASVMKVVHFGHQKQSSKVSGNVGGVGS